MAGKVHEVRIDLSKPLADDPGTGHNRWHPGSPPILRMDPGDEAVLETRCSYCGATKGSRRRGLSTSMVVICSSLMPDLRKRGRMRFRMCAYPQPP